MLMKLVITILCASLAAAISLRERVPMEEVREGHGWLLLAQMPVERGLAEVSLDMQLLTPRRH